MASIQYKSGKNSKRTFYVVVSHLGKHKWIRAGTQADAKRLKREIESLKENERIEKLGLTTRNKRIDDFFYAYLENVRLRSAPNTTKRYRAAVNAFIAFLKLFHPTLRYLSQIKQEHIENYQSKRLESVKIKELADGDKVGTHKMKRLPKPQTVNYEIGVLRSAFLWALDHNWIAIVPTRKVKSLRPGPKREIRLLSSKECGRLLKTASKLGKKDSKIAVCAFVFRFFLNTGLRSGELCNLTWTDVNLQTGQIQIRAKEGWTPKTSERNFYLNDVCLEMLKAMPKSESYVFMHPLERQFEPDELRRTLIEVAKNAGLDGLTRVHDLRHTFSTIGQELGISRETMGEILGHEDGETTKIYTHPTAQHLKSSINKVRIG